jgi:hypothetical protein
VAVSELSLVLAGEKEEDCDDEHHEEEFADGHTSAFTFTGAVVFRFTVVPS